MPVLNHFDCLLSAGLVADKTVEGITYGLKVRSFHNFEKA
jgi:hypothetical protein